MANESKKAPAPLMPKVQEVTSVEALLPIARQIVKRPGYQMLDGLNLKPGMKVLMIVDSTNDRLVQEAFEIAVPEAGGIVELIDLEGTDMRVALSKEDWDKGIEKMMKREGLPHMRGHLGIPVAFKKGEGTLAASSLTFGGIVSRVKMTIEGGRVTEVIGGGYYGDTLRRSFEEFKDLTSPDNPRPGVNWVSSFGLCTHPLARRSAFMDRLTGSARIHAHAFGHRRSGIIHTSIGAGVVGGTYKIIRHIDQYFTTLIADGKKIIDRGHLLALDDPKVHKIAEKFGDPKQLLTEAWIPAVSGVNAP